ncbi:MAG TPA: protein-disulfide reductase DsbD domain-containing protein [Terriglobia bacterium]|nr:protein-disulfide reductase DsbD domain-containing protein [Terriglobia bacterium]
MTESRVTLMHRLFWGCSLVCLAASVMAADKTPPVVTASAVLATDAAHPGSIVQAALVARITPGYHINAHQPSHEYLIPSELKINPNPQVTVQDIQYPPGMAIKFEFDDAKLSVYEGTLVVRAELKIARGTKPGEYTLKGKFAYQACNDRACFPPTSVPVELAVKVVRPNVAVKQVHGDLFKRVKVE